MLNTILGTKIEMSQAYEGSIRTPITLIQAGPCIVTQIKSVDKDGYQAIQISFGQKRVKGISRALQGHAKKAMNKATGPRFLTEIKLDEDTDLKVGDTIKVSEIFVKGDTIQITGISKGKGFQGGVKRWGFAGGPKTHGQSDRHRAPGSIGQGTTPGRVWKGKKMAGHMGADKVTVKNLKVISVDPQKNQIAVSGPVPGIPGKLLTIKRLSKPQIKTEQVVNESNE
jgi:large subunit ribosomal protein L3